MLRLFAIEEGKLKELATSEHSFNGDMSAAWIDAHDPSEEERNQLQTFLRMELPESE